MLAREFQTQYTYYDKDIETCSREALQELQIEKLKKLLTHVWDSNGFYTNKWKSAGVSDVKDIAGLEDFQKLPLTQKSEYVQDQAENPPYGTNLTYDIENYVRFHQTSGTTGKPLKWLDTTESWDNWARCWCFVYGGAGVTAADRIFFPFSFGPFVGFWSAFEGARKLGALAFPGGGQDTVTRINFILENKPTVICSTPSYALRLAEAALEMGVDLSKSSVQKTIHAGEPGASIPATKKKIETLWGAKCYDHHGMTEVGAMSFTCNAEPQGVHLNESEFYFEILDPETGQEVPDGQEGELVVTNLGRWGMPVIRYRTGDKVKVNRSRCDCGRTFMRMEGGILGRVDDMLIVRGVNVFPSAIENIIRAYDQVSEFKVEVYKEKEMDELNLLLEIDQNVYSQEEIAKLIRTVKEDLKANLQIRVDIGHVAAGTLPRFEMKAKRVIRVDQPTKL